jgi:hypothetical protein
VDDQKWHFVKFKLPSSDVSWLSNVVNRSNRAGIRAFIINDWLRLFLSWKKQTLHFQKFSFLNFFPEKRLIVGKFASKNETLKRREPRRTWKKSWGRFFKELGLCRNLKTELGFFEMWNLIVLYVTIVVEGQSELLYLACEKQHLNYVNIGKVRYLGTSIGYSERYLHTLVKPWIIYY